jgi:hypothetical protein
VLSISSFAMNIDEVHLDRPLAQPEPAVIAHFFVLAG